MNFDPSLPILSMPTKSLTTTTALSISNVSARKALKSGRFITAGSNSRTKPFFRWQWTASWTLWTISKEKPLKLIWANSTLWYTSTSWCSKYVLLWPFATTGGWSRGCFHLLKTKNNGALRTCRKVRWWSWDWSSSVGWICGRIERKWSSARFAVVQRRKSSCSETSHRRGASCRNRWSGAFRQQTTGLRRIWLNSLRARWTM